MTKGVEQQLSRTLFKVLPPTSSLRLKVLALACKPWQRDRTKEKP